MQANFPRGGLRVARIPRVLMDPADCIRATIRRGGCRDRMELDLWSQVLAPPGDLMALGSLAVGFR